MAPGVRDVAARPRVVGGLSGLITLVAYAPGMSRALDYDSAQTVAFFVFVPWPFDALVRRSAFNNHPFFSLLESTVHWLTGSREEAVLRLFPILFGAAAVGLLAWWAARRWGSLAGATAGGVLAVNPMFADLSRAVRGYSLLVLCAVAATVLLGRLLREPEQRRSWPGIGYAAAVGVGLATHLYMGVVVVAHVAAVLARRSLDRQLVTMWGLAGLIAVPFYARIGAHMVEAAVNRGRNFKPDFLADLAESLLGGKWAAAVLLAPVVVVGLATVWRFLEVRAAAVVGLAGVALAWISAGTDLGPRFFVWIVPAVAALVAAGVAAHPRLAILAAASMVVSAAGQVDGWTAPPSRYPEVAAVVEDLDASGWDVCVLDLSVPPLLAYTDRFEPVTGSEQLAQCDAAVTISAWLDGALADEAADEFSHQYVLDPDMGAVLYASRSVPDLGQ